METESTKQEQNTEKTFTQAEVDIIVKDRLKRDREKYADYDALKEKASKFDELEAANKSELEKALEKANSLQKELDGIKAAQQLREMREKIANENNVPIEFLTGTTEEECNQQAEKVKEMLSASGVPVKVVDGGEILNPGKQTSGQIFEKWAKEQL